MITKELRKYVWDKVPSKHLEALIDLANEIEQAHEEALKQAQAEVLADCLSVADDFIELPKDADGMPIRIGDELESVRYEDGIVAGIRYYEGGSTLIAVRPHGWDTPTWNDPEDYTHAKPDTWEAIIEDAASYGGKRQFSGTQGDKANIAELVERCKRLAGEDA